MFNPLLATVATAALVALSPAHVQAQSLKELNFGIISTEASQNLKQDWQPILDDLARKTGCECTGVMRVPVFRLRSVQFPNWANPRQTRRMSHARR